MASLNNPVNLQNIIDRFADYVVAAANSGIVWGFDNKPFPEMDGYYFGGFTNGKSISIQGQGYQGTKIYSNIYEGVLLETFRYSNIRNMRALLYVTFSDDPASEGWGGNIKPPPGGYDLALPYDVPYPPRAGGYIFDQTAKAHLSTSFTYSTDSGRLARGQISPGNRITRTGLEDLFDRARSLYYDFQDDTVEVTITVCHSSCHYS
jgi:hypothetical protein